MTRVIVVSGGGSGIGRAVAASFARIGDDVLVIGRRADALERTAAEIKQSASAGTVTAVAADLSEPSGARQVRDVVQATFGRVDVIVNNAGGNVLTRDGNGHGLDWACRHWLGNFRTNVLTAVLLTEALGDLLADQGRVVLLSSIAAYRGSGSGSYAGAKAALHSYAFDLAAALGKRGITVNVVAPGYIEGTEFFAAGPSVERRQALIRQTLTGRAGRVEDVAETIRWLASPAAGHVTGQVIQVNGGALLGR